MKKNIRILIVVAFFSIWVFSAKAQTFTEFTKAITEKNEKLVFDYIRAGVNVNQADYHGYTPLHFAAETGNVYIVNLLIKNGADVNAESAAGISPLISSVTKNFPEITQILIQNNADINHKDEFGNTALLYAAAYGFPQETWVLCNAGADISTENNGDNAFAVATFFGDTEIMSILFDFGADINQKDNLGFTPLMVATQNNFIHAVKFLAEKNANLNLTNEQNFTALDLAAYYSYNEILEFLLQKNAVSGKNSHNALQLAIYSGNNSGAKIISKNNNLKLKFPDKHSVGFLNQFGFFDYFSGLRYSYTLSAINTDFSLDFLIRPYRKKILVQESGNLFYQYREFKFMSGISMQKKFNLYKKSNTQKGIFAGAGEYFAFSNYKGVEQNSNSFVFVPEAGIYFAGNKSQLLLSYKYVKFDVYNQKKSFVGFTWSAFINKEISVFKKELYDF